MYKAGWKLHLNASLFLRDESVLISDKVVGLRKISLSTVENFPNLA